MVNVVASATINTITNLIAKYQNIFCTIKKIFEIDSQNMSKNYIHKSKIIIFKQNNLATMDTAIKIIIFLFIRDQDHLNLHGPSLEIEIVDADEAD